MVTPAGTLVGGGMSDREKSDFRRRQAIADLRHQALILSAATVRRMVAGIGASRAPGLQKRMEWYFSGKVPLSNLRRDGVLYGAVLMTSALPDEDFESFLAANILLLLERLTAEGGTDDGFWNWERLAPHYRLARPVPRAAIMCGFRESARLGRIAIPGGPSGEDCLSATRDAVLNAVAPLSGKPAMLAEIERAILDEADARRAGELWTRACRSLLDLGDEERRAAVTGFRYLYERPASIDPPPEANAPPIPVQE